MAQGRALAELTAAAAQGGADVIQLRAKELTTRELIEEARRCLLVTKAAGVPLIINDRADVARVVGADGVHLGQDDLPVAAAREILGPGRVVGQSTHGVEQALAGAAEGADYLGFGPLFSTPTKPGYPPVGLGVVRQVVAAVHIPIVAIGGIEQRNLDSVLEAGAHCVAVVRAVCAAPDPERASRALKRALHFYSRGESGGPIIGG